MKGFWTPNITQRIYFLGCPNGVYVKSYTENLNGPTLSKLGLPYSYLFLLVPKNRPKTETQIYILVQHFKSYSLEVPERGHPRLLLVQRTARATSPGRLRLGRGSIADDSGSGGGGRNTNRGCNSLGNFDFF